MLKEMVEQKTAVGSLAPAIEQFLKVTSSFAPGLFQCYDVGDLPRTNNALGLCVIMSDERPDDAVRLQAW